MGFVELVKQCGPVDVVPTKTRVAIMVRVRFAGVSRVSERRMTRGFALRRPLKHPRIRKVERLGPKWYGHWLRITSPEELDDEVLGWLRESYKVGEQRYQVGRRAHHGAD